MKQKSEVQDAEIQKLQQNAQEATFLADQESSKFLVANEVMKSVASQVLFLSLFHQFHGPLGITVMMSTFYLINLKATIISLI